jgi:hypothetical protein
MTDPILSTDDPQPMLQEDDRRALAFWAAIMLAGIALLLAYLTRPAGAASAVQEHPYYGCKVRVVMVATGFQWKVVRDRRGRPICRRRT